MTHEIIETAFGPVSVVVPRLGPSSPAATDMVRRFTDVLLQMPQVPFVTEHMLHAGMYTRTVRLPPDTACAAVLIKVPTVLVTMGDALFFSNEEVFEITGFSVLPGSAGRKIAFFTKSDFGMSMVFPTDAKTIDEAEKQFTDEYNLLVPLSKEDAHRILITGE